MRKMLEPGSGGCISFGVSLDMVKRNKYLDKGKNAKTQV